MKISLVTLGCHKNLVDSENLLGVLLSKYKYSYTDDPKEAEIIIVNTCGFIEDAKKESLETIIELGDYKNSGNLKKLIISGCLSQRYGESLLEELPEADAVIGTGEVEKIGEIIKKTLEGEKVVENDNLDYISTSATQRVITTYPHTTYIKIAEGCNNICSYCVIPSIRGKYRSRIIEDVVTEVKELVSGGVKEINLIAQDTTKYGQDIYGKSKLIELLKELVKIDDLEWIRIYYMYPKDISDELIELISEQDKICNYIDMPIQHISNRILKLMNRHSTKEEIIDIINKIKSKIKNVVIRSSFIVGFPSETVEEFEELKSFLTENEFDYAGIFKYSKEEGTKAFDIEDQIDQEEIEERWVELTNLQSKIAENKNKHLMNKKLKVMIDCEIDEGEFNYEGRTNGQGLEIDGRVLINSEKSLEPGEIIDINIEDSFGYDLIGGKINE